MSARTRTHRPTTASPRSPRAVTLRADGSEYRRDRVFFPSSEHRTTYRGLPASTSTEETAADADHE